MSKIERKPKEEWDLLKARQIIVERNFAMTLVESCVAVKQMRLAKVIMNFDDTLDVELADTLGFYSVEDLHKFLEERKTEEE